jgi:hypothetical protein
MRKATLRDRRFVHGSLLQYAYEGMHMAFMPKNISTFCDEEQRRNASIEER